MTHVKICGLTNLADARMALMAGADLLGFNFYPPSPRYVSPGSVLQILDALREEFRENPFRTVGVFVNEPRERVVTILSQCGLDRAQLHGDESPVYVAAFGAGAYKALRPETQAEADEWIGGLLNQRSLDGPTWLPPAFLIDASHPSLYGGTGHTGDWTLARSLASRFPILLAGGLAPSNVGDAIRAVEPWGVDVASGVESEPGRKSADKLREFISVAKSA